VPLLSQDIHREIESEGAHAAAHRRKTIQMLTLREAVLIPGEQERSREASLLRKV
jgi:hypothetical protein